MCFTCSFILEKKTNDGTIGMTRQYALTRRTAETHKNIISSAFVSYHPYAICTGIEKGFWKKDNGIQKEMLQKDNFENMVTVSSDRGSQTEVEPERNIL